MITDTVIIRHLPGKQPYAACWQAMKDFTDQRHADTIDELWIVEHEPVFTQGQNGKPEHVLQPGTIPIIQTDRGGQVTYHGPGQLVVYTLIDVKRKKFNVRELVTHLEQAVIQLLANHAIAATARCDAPGVYVAEKKICSIGLRIRRGYAYHGLALNVEMDLEPFSRINPCGYAALEMTQVHAHIPGLSFNQTAEQLIACLMKKLAYTTPLGSVGDSSALAKKS